MLILNMHFIGFLSRVLNLLKLYVMFGLHIHFLKENPMNSDHQRVNIFTRLKCFFKPEGVIFIEYL